MNIFPSTLVVVLLRWNVRPSLSPCFPSKWKDEFYEEEDDGEEGEGGEEEHKSSSLSLYNDDDGDPGY